MGYNGGYLGKALEGGGGEKGYVFVYWEIAKKKTERRPDIGLDVITLESKKKAEVALNLTPLEEKGNCIYRIECNLHYLDCRLFTLCMSCFYP